MDALHPLESDFKECNIGDCADGARQPWQATRV